MTTPFEFKSRGSSQNGRSVVSRTATGFLFLLLLPVAAIFCWQWNSAGSAQQTKAVSGENTDELGPREPVGYASPDSDFLPAIPNPRFGEEKADSVRDPFFALSGRAMISANGDPYLWARANGISEGRLVVKSRSGGIPVLGPALPASHHASMTDREILQALQGNASGSFRNFFNKLFGAAEDAAFHSPELQENQEENPFSRIKESLSETKTAEKSENSAAEAKSERNSTSEQTKTETTGTATAETIVSPTPANVSRPYLMMQMTEAGALRVMAASQPQDGVLESAELGLEDFSIIPFGDAPDFPIAIAVGDYNSDGIADIAFDVAPQGLLRFLYGSADGTFQEGLRVEIGRGPRSLAAGDFNGDGKTDIAISNIGTGLITVLLADPTSVYRFETFWSDTYRDYIVAADSGKNGGSDVAGMTFANHGSIVVTFNREEGTVTNQGFDFAPAMNSVLSSTQGSEYRVQAVTSGWGYSVNMDNRMGQFMNVLNVAPGSNTYVVVGDMSGRDRYSINIAARRPRQ